MKTQIIFTALTACILITSCKQEKEIAKTEPVLQITEKTAFSSGFNAPAQTGNKTRDYMAYRKELAAQNVPLDVTVFAKNDWKQFYSKYQQAKPQLSEGAQLYCERMQIEYFELYNQALSKPDKQIVLNLISHLADHKYGGFKQLYYYLNWFKSESNDFTGWETVLNKVKSYAVVSKPDPSKPDSPELEQNPALKAELQRMVAALKERDGYVEKIKAL
jgi:hypothetical protein